MVFIGGTYGVSGLLLIALPFVDNFGLLVTIRCIQSVLLGAFITTDCTIPVVTMGPERSRPFTNALHAMVGLGFLGGTFLVRPFLPADAVAAKNRDEVCQTGNVTLTTEEATSGATSDLSVSESPEVEYLLGIDKIAWPFVITGIWCVLFSLGYVILGVLKNE